MRAIILFISLLFLVSCQQPKKERVYHKLQGTEGYAYQDDDLLWHLYVYDVLTGQYTYSTTSTPIVVDSSPSSFEPSATTVSNYDEAASDMSETTGEATGGSDTSEPDNSGGMSESDGSSEGGSDSGSSDGGGGE